jgi:hypothetical protein
MYFMQGFLSITLHSPESNEEDVVQTFEIPIGTKDDYVFAMTLANDHKAVITKPNFPSATLPLAKSPGLNRCFPQRVHGLSNVK